MTDLHLRIGMVAKQRQQELDHHDAADHARGPRDLERAARWTKANVAAAQARRRYAHPGRAR